MTTTSKHGILLLIGAMMFTATGCSGVTTKLLPEAIAPEDESHLFVRDGHLEAGPNGIFSCDKVQDLFLALQSTDDPDQTYTEGSNTPEYYFRATLASRSDVLPSRKALTQEIQHTVSDCRSANLVRAISSGGEQPVIFEDRGRKRGQFPQRVAVGLTRSNYALVVTVTPRNRSSAKDWSVDIADIYDDAEAKAESFKKATSWEPFKD